MKTKQFIIISAFAIAFTSCKKDNPTPQASATNASPTTFTNGVFIINQGPFSSGTGTISFYRRDSAKVTTDIFQNVNGYPLGNIVQSMTLFNGNGYIVVNNAGKMEVVNANTFKTAASITGLNNPRYFLGINNNKGYLSQWNASGAGSIKVINLINNMISATIPTGAGAENMIKLGNSVYVACNGGFGSDSVVTVIDATADTVIKNINVGANPTYIQGDANGKIWVLCVGQWNGSYSALAKTGMLVKINPNNNTVELSLTFTSTSSQPSILVTNSSKNMLYYTYNGGVYSQDINSSVLNQTAIINRNFYGLGIDPTNNYFYAADAGNYTSNGKVIRYNASGVAVDSFPVGISPGNFWFN
jgi:YVTN family beta-propeller protein